MIERHFKIMVLAQGWVEDFEYTEHKFTHIFKATKGRFGT